MRFGKIFTALNGEKHLIRHASCDTFPSRGRLERTNSVRECKNDNFHYHRSGTGKYGYLKS